MPAIITPFVGFALGVFLALGVRGAADRYEDRDLRGAIAIAALFGALVFAPASGYFLAFAGDWSFGYLLDARTIPSALFLLLVIFDAAIVPIGFIAAHRAARRRAHRELVALGAVPTSIAFVFVVAFYRELRIEGTFHQVRSDFGTEPVAGGPLGYAVLWIDAMIAVGFALAARALAPSASRAPAPSSEPVGPLERSKAELAEATPGATQERAEPQRLLGRKR